jgi:hypothetical protein
MRGSVSPRAGLDVSAVKQTYRDRITVTQSIASHYTDWVNSKRRGLILKDGKLQTFDCAAKFSEKLELVTQHPYYKISGTNTAIHICSKEKWSKRLEILQNSVHINY